MKNKILAISALMLLLIGCEDYLDNPPEAALYEEDVFKSYERFQGFLDRVMLYVVDYNRHGARTTQSLGGECVSIAGQSVILANLGQYSQQSNGLMNRFSIYMPINDGSPGERTSAGLYTHMWEALRITNLSLEMLESGILTQATEEERDWLEGQALFFRAFWHYEYVRSFGTIPYIDLVIPSDEQTEYMKRHWSYEKNGRTYRDTQAVFERIVEDMEAAAELLPAVWPFPNINYGRPTSLAARGYKAKALQYSASPLFHEQATGNTGYDTELLERTAAAAQEAIDAAKAVIGQHPAGMPMLNADGLTNWADIRQMYTQFSGRVQPGTGEVLFKKPTNSHGAMAIRQTAARVYGAMSLTGQHGAQATQQYVDKFEMNDGTRYKPEYDRMDDKRWENRDPRFDLCFYVHGDQVGNVFVNLSNAGRDRQINCYIIRKYLPNGAHRNNVGTTAYATPLLRLADIYLTYAEAAFESTGSYTTVPPGGKMTAEEAVNVVRTRAGMPTVAETLPSYNASTTLPQSEELASDDPFRLLYRNERAVELAFEGHYWFDIRRWKRAHLKDGSPLEVLAFDLVAGTSNVDNQTVQRVAAEANGTYTFKQPHYWMPFRNDLINFSSDWEQNPGW